MIFSKVYGFKWSIIYIQNYYFNTFSKKNMKRHNNMWFFMDYHIYFIITISPLNFFGFFSPMYSHQVFKKFTRVQTRYHEPHPTLLGDCLLGVYFEIFLEFEQNSLKNSWKFLKIFITLLNYGLLKKNTKFFHFPKKNPFISPFTI